MALTMGLSSAELNAYKTQISQNHSVRVKAQIWTLDHQFVQNISDLAPDGQINIDAKADVSRSATVTLFDPTHTVAYDTANPMLGTVSPRYLLALWRGVYVDKPALTGWVDVPLGVLWINRAARQGDILTLEAQGKEALLNFPFTNPNAPGAPYTIKKGTGCAQAIRALLGLYGEYRTRMVATSAKLGRDLVITRDMTTWQAIKLLAAAASCNCFYDAQGYFVLRRLTTTSVFQFDTGPSGVIRDVGEIGFSSDQLVNAVIGTGQTPTTANTEPPHAIATVPTNSPIRLIRGGKVITIPMLVDNDTLKTASEVKAFVTETLNKVNRSGAETISLTVTSSPVPHLQEFDYVMVVDEPTGYTSRVPWITASIPLRTGPQTNGYQRNLKFTARRLQRRGSPK